MTIKISAVSINTGEIVLTLTFDNPAGSGHMQSVNIRKNVLVGRLLEVRILLGRPLTILDARLALTAIVNEVRQGKTGIPEDFDFSPYVGQELEP